ncbi:carbon-phosphorus lyase complex subunit PhnI [Pseudonocardia kunmingensis]|uniref:Alpha-D-ribose 1-methylphosphonate 5-triphosphate synthase subunit PhnI n=1 Tax=Pseudonocardia kunmingensis TaxID=630975 RepID=A0A543D3W9_9PSEU|nr:carbon-phosphorus lyase complex subunit PhnI [Pseudonocardia kunmingensis]TQM04036.1 alpha-D-ribose 1-methylphosphonate 5-triphosphate synthase subunit PhnI [Pseudonocardia kunmingensis]
MGYAAVKGGLDAILAAEDLVARMRVDDPSPWLEEAQLIGRLRLAVDRVQGEGGLASAELAARAIRQAEGDLIEAALLVRSYRSTLPRLGYTLPTPTAELEAVRRIVPAFREPPGRQLLGRTLDYTERLVDFRDEAAARAALREPPAGRGDVDPEARQPRLAELLAARGLLANRQVEGDPDPVDITREPVITPAPRSARLAALARGETGALVNLWYQGVRGDRRGAEDVTLGEVRVGTLPVTVAHPRTGGAVRVGSVPVTEVEAMSNLNRPDEDTGVFDIGYGLVLGHNERKAIAMAVLDVAMHRDRGRTGLEQNVIGTCDGTDASGFLEHLKLPHYVTFGSQVERKEAIRK